MTQLRIKRKGINLATVFFSTLTLLSACNQEKPSETQDKKPAEEAKEITWKDLRPSKQQQASIKKKYQEQLNQITEDNSENSLAERQTIWNKITTEINNVPGNKALNGTRIKVSGYATPLDVVDGYTNEFLLLPHVKGCGVAPPPSPTQTILVVAKKGAGMPMVSLHRPILVTGEVTVDRKDTDEVKAGYIINDAEVKVF